MHTTNPATTSTMAAPMTEPRMMGKSVPAIVLFVTCPSWTLQMCQCKIVGL